MIQPEKFTSSQKNFLFILLSIATLWLLLNAIIFGIGFAWMDNIQNSSSFGEYEPAIPSKVLDINGKLITEFLSEENRKIIPLGEMPNNLLQALLTREDLGFFEHFGFSFRNLIRASVNIFTGSYYSGGSTLTQQLSKIMYTDQAYRSLRRKLEEVFYSLQLEKKLSKQEILEQYLNKMYFGYGNYGVQTASEYYFNKPASDMSVAESVMLVIQLANPSYYTPLRFAERAKAMQKEILNKMVENNFISQEEADSSHEEYWNNFDWSRSNVGAFFLREDKAPYFSEYLREEIPQYLSGNSNIYKDGYTIYSTLHLEAQEYAQGLIAETARRANIVVQNNNRNESSSINSQIVPVIDLMADLFNLTTMRVNGKHLRKEAIRNFYEKNIDEIALFSTLLGQDNLEEAVGQYSTRHQKDTSGEVVEGALIALDHSSPATMGYIVSMVGGEAFTANNQFNRAISANVQAGSAFKPLFYAAAIDKKKVTTATLLVDSPVAFQIDEYSDLYTPNNFRGEWRGQVLLREALARSLNIPAIKVLQILGFDDAISYTTRMLHINDPKVIEREFPRSLPIALGTMSVSPMQMAIAYSIFANEGKDIIPIAIRYIEDRNGNIISQPEKVIWDKLNAMGANAQIITPQASYVITHILQTSTVSGYLRGPIEMAGGISMPLAGKTGTTQNTSSGWTVGYSPYITTAVWFGFDKPGKSLGATQSGGLLPAPLWAKFMKFYHKDLPIKEFPRPEDIVNVTIQAATGLLPEGHPQEKLITEVFIKGTEPTQRSRFYQDLDDFYDSRLESLFENSTSIKTERALGNLSLNIPLDLKKAIPEENIILNMPIQNTSLGEHSLQLPADIFSKQKKTNSNNRTQESSLYILQGASLEEEASQNTMFNSSQNSSIKRRNPIPIEEEFTIDT